MHPDRLTRTLGAALASHGGAHQRVHTADLTLPLFLITLLMLSAPTSASAATAANPKPTAAITRFYGPVGAPGSEEWRVVVDAGDPNGVIWEVDVLWGDGAISYATTECVQGHTPGAPAHLVIPHNYTHSGVYRLQAVAISYQRCPLDGPPGREQHSTPAERTVTVKFG